MVLVVALALVAVSFVRVLLVEYRLSLEKNALQADIVRLRQENEQLRQQISYLQTDAAIEKLARKELGWTKPGETAVIVLGGQSTPAPTKQPDTTPLREQDQAPPDWWGRLLHGIGVDR